ncbi:MAG: formate dehydrogenase [Candidatus Desulfofervidaceae bacterium]|nr:formate dehydrogenase [Candidatus Desulfofervidaceae bacterium]
MGGKSFFIDTSRCTACRGCQIACKEWHGLPATPTKQWGSHQNPKDLNFYTYKLVRFSEHEKRGKLVWYFFPDQCRHCLEPPCKDVADGYVKGAIIKDPETGAVIYNLEKLKKVPFDELLDACPYHIPRQDPKTGMVAKCDMCIDRVKAGLLPMCVKTCPTGAMNFGERDEMLALAQKRLAEVKRKFPNAQLCDPEDVRVIYLVLDNPKLYHKFAIASVTPGITRKAALRKLLNPVGFLQTLG